MLDRATSEELRDFILKRGARSEEIIIILGRSIKFFEAVFESEVGQELLKDLVDKYKSLLQDIANDTTYNKKGIFEKMKDIFCGYESSNRKIVELQVIQQLINTWCDKINRYNQVVGYVKKVTK